MKTYLSDDRHKTCKRIHESGDTHFITFSCYKRRPLLNNNDALSILGASLSDACITTDTALWSYVFMPEHVHLLIHPRSALFTTSHFSCRLHNTHVIETLPVWQQGGGYDRNIHSREELAQKLTYIHNNPVRRALCNEPESYFWSSAGEQSLNMDRLVDLCQSVRTKANRSD
jgi:putative transposase